MDYLLLIVLIIILAIVLYASRSHILSIFGAGKLVYSDLKGTERSNMRESLRKNRRMHQWPGYEDHQDLQAQRLLSSTWQVAKKNGKTIINVSGDANGYIELIDWPSNDTWMYQPNNNIGSYCLDMTKEYDDKIISRINTYLTAERSV